MVWGNYPSLLIVVFDNIKHVKLIILAIGFKQQSSAVILTK